MKKLLCFILTGMILVGLCGCNASLPIGTDAGVLNPNEKESGQKKGLAFSAQYIRTDGYVDGARFPRTVVIRSVEELRDYYTKNCDTFDLGRRDKVYSDTTIGFLDACDKYTEEYFKDKMLIMVLVEHGSGSIRDEVTKVELAENGSLQVSIQQIVPEVGTCDMAEWHILIELDAGIDVDAEDVVVNNIIS